MGGMGQQQYRGPWFSDFYTWSNADGKNAICTVGRATAHLGANLKYNLKTINSNILLVF